MAGPRCEDFDAASTVRIEILEASARAEAASLWTALEKRLPGCGLTYGWDWTSTWLDHFGGVVPHRFAVGRCGAELIGVALVTFDAWRRGGLSLRRAHLGTAGEPAGESIYVERNGLLAIPAHAEAFASGVMDASHRARGWDAFILDGFLVEDASAFLGIGDRWAVRADTALVADLTLIGDEGPATPFSTGVRREWRRAERLAGPFEVEWAESPERALAILDELMPLHQARWEAVGVPGTFASERVRAFHRDLVTRLTASGRVALTRVSGAQGLLGCRYDFVEHDRLLAYQAGWAPVPDSRVSTGFALDLACMGAANARGLRCWDHLAGPQRHKRRLSTGGYELCWATRRRGRVRWAAVDTARGARRLARRGDDVRSEDPVAG